MDAIMGMGSLCLHLMSNMSSKNPSMVAISSESTEERYTESYKIVSIEHTLRPPITYLEMGKFGFCQTLKVLANTRMICEKV